MIVNGMRVEGGMTRLEFKTNGSKVTIEGQQWQVVNKSSTHVRCRNEKTFKMKDFVRGKLVW